MSGSAEEEDEKRYNTDPNYEGEGKSGPEGTKGRLVLAALLAVTFIAVAAIIIWLLVRLLA